MKMNGSQFVLNSEQLKNILINQTVEFEAFKIFIASQIGKNDPQAYTDFMELFKSGFEQSKKNYWKQLMHNKTDLSGFQVEIDDSE